MTVTNGIAIELQTDRRNQSFECPVRCLDELLDCIVGERLIRKQRNVGWSLINSVSFILAKNTCVRVHYLFLWWLSVQSPNWYQPNITWQNLTKFNQQSIRVRILKVHARTVQWLTEMENVCIRTSWSPNSTDLYFWYLFVELAVVNLFKHILFEQYLFGPILTQSDIDQAKSVWTNLYW